MFSRKCPNPPKPQVHSIIKNDHRLSDLVPVSMYPLMWIYIIKFKKTHMPNVCVCMCLNRD